MDLSDIDRDIERWKKLLEDAGLRSTLHESQLVRFLLVHMCGRYERAVNDLLSERAKVSGDMALASYVENAYRVRKEPRWRYLQNEILGSFGREHREWFASNVTDRAKLFYESLIDNRNRSAHGLYIDASLDDVVVWHGYAKQVLDAFEGALRRSCGDTSTPAGV